MSRSAILVWLLAVSCMDTAAAAETSLSAIVGESVMLHCPCPEATDKLSWQIGDNIVVNYYGAHTNPLDETYGERTEIFLNHTKGNCSLLLHDVSLDDQKTFTCYVFEEDDLRHIQRVTLNVKEAEADHRQFTEPSPPIQSPRKAYTVGVPLTLILVILTVLIVALLVKMRQQRRPEGLIFLGGPHSMPEMNHTPV